MSDSLKGPKATLQLLQLWSLTLFSEQTSQKNTLNCQCSEIAAK